MDKFPRTDRSPSRDKVVVMRTAGPSQADRSSSAPFSEASTGASYLPDSVLRNLWYIVMSGESLHRSPEVRQNVFGIPVIIWRHNDGHIAVESLSANPPSAHTEKYISCTEQHGLIWAYSGPRQTEPPCVLPCFDGERPQIVESLDLPCDFESAVYGLLDPAHVPFVHRCKWWKPRRQPREKTKVFVPTARGFRMVQHSSTQGELVYRAMGGDSKTEIIFELPAIRIEVISGSIGRVCSVTSVIPLTPSTTRLTHSLYWTMKGLAILKPLIRSMTRTFLHEDRTILARQQEGLRYSPQQILVNDADKLMKWYLRLSKEWRESQMQNREFINPIAGGVLQWRT